MTVNSESLMHTPPVLEIRNLSIAFRQYSGAFSQRKLDTIRNISLSVNKGEMVAIVGASGSGKSLLAHAILGILPYNASLNGDIRYLGEKLDSNRVKELRGHEIVLVPQSVNYLDPLMKTGKQLACGGSGSKEKINNTFSRYGLPENTAELYPFELSGGMARRVLISSAVIENPKLVIADEPTPGLHPEAAKRVMSHFREMADEGAGVLLITHDLELALECADRITVFYDGETIDEVYPRDFDNPEALEHPYTRALYKAMPKNGFEPTYDLDELVKGGKE